MRNRYISCICKVIVSTANRIKVKNVNAYKHEMNIQNNKAQKQVITEETTITTLTAQNMQFHFVFTVSFNQLVQLQSLTFLLHGLPWYLLAELQNTV